MAGVRVGSFLKSPIVSLEKMFREAKATLLSMANRKPAHEKEIWVTADRDTPKMIGKSVRYTPGE